MSRDIEVWAGVECTVNRVGDTYHDQMERNGHANRLADLERVQSLGVRALRYPVLWERTERAPGIFDFAWADERLDLLRTLGVRPIVGLLHHGSGPRWTHLLDPGFAEGLARHAAATARRYPWVSDYTPVNEPLTTARFSALYGHWYPHAKDDRAFVRALFAQVRGTVLSMRAIRAVNPGARLIQTEDACTVSASHALRHQARFENLRRWLSLDLLSGRVTPSHPLHDWLIECGIEPVELERLASAPCPPDVIGLNYYVTSDRWLDEHVEHYPAHTHGGNGQEVYADVEAVRVRTAGIAGHERILLDAWRRYRAALAITEVHLGCSIEEQIRWFVEAYRSARAARKKGADVRAVTAWAIFGAHDWSSLVTREEGAYEAGLFDVRSGEPVATDLADVVVELATRGETSSPHASGLGWWRRPERSVYDCARCRQAARNASATMEPA